MSMSSSLTEHADRTAKLRLFRVRDPRELRSFFFPQVRDAVVAGAGMEAWPKRRRLVGKQAPLRPYWKHGMRFWVPPRRVSARLVSPPLPAVRDPGMRAGPSDMCVS